MAGIYLHIPFCKQACHYCNFHFSTSKQYQQQVIDAMIKEIDMRKDYIKQEQVASVYFGGGTPSLLTNQQLDSLFNTLHKHFSIAPNAEITFEANPDDLTLERILDLKQTPINRFSIGVQSFFDEELTWMNRAHKGIEAITAIQNVQATGFDNITIDLIYGSPTLTNQKWEANLQQAINLNLQHISSYCLSVEPKTALDTFIKQQKYPALNEEQASQQFAILTNTLESNGFEQYEISNFARKNNYAVHNTNYWKGELYLGIGPSAHSFNKVSRSWNVANNHAYSKGIKEGNLVMETEILTIENRVNEYIMTSLRTIWGFNRKSFKQEFGNKLSQKMEAAFQHKIDAGLIYLDDDCYKLKKDTRILADGIASDLFLVAND
ncbi:coproporphyrinogen III oxidase [Bacteroidetes bacterium UKL13-3]|nr:coproporphyrinogen III oxidase [Bacteroidetes bacterium UKL13-3]HCP93209.1 coproporphyrinogen III oxidase [Bacteroidota bacterium]